VIRTIENTAYYNSGDWVESLSALTEDFEGKIELITGYATANVLPFNAHEDGETAPSALAAS
jgi:hypothetical protein